MSTADGCCCCLRVANSARRFEPPVLGVKLALEKKWIEPGQSILDFGAGCLRNARFLQSVLRTPVYAFDTPQTVARFADDYHRFEQSGGVVVDDPAARRFDRVIVSFVLETLCPCSDAPKQVLKTAYSCLKPGGMLILSVRGRSDVVDNLNPAVTRYCRRSRGFLTPLHTYIRPYSQGEIRRLLEGCGFCEVTLLQTYRLASPRKLHVVARRPPSHRRARRSTRRVSPPSEKGARRLALDVLKGRPGQRPWHAHR